MAASASKSKKPSVANFASKLPEGTVFFLDRALGRHRLPGLLRERGLTVEVHDHHFSAAVEDRLWLAEVGSRGWIVLTKDRQIRYRAVELAALVRHGVRAFVFTRGDLAAEDMAEAFAKAFRSIAKLIRKGTRPLVATVSRGGAVQVIFGDD